MTDRFHSLDFLRAFALLMGVLIHVLMLFLEPFDGSEPRLGASVIFIWIHVAHAFVHAFGRVFYRS